MNDAHPHSLASSTLTTGVVTIFLAIAGLIGLTDGKEAPVGAAFAAGWGLRGTLAPAAEASAAPPDQASAARGARAPLQGSRNPV